MGKSRFARVFAVLFVFLMTTSSFVVAETQKPKLVMFFSVGGSGNSLKSSAEKFGKLYNVDIEALLFPISEVYEKEVLALSTQQAVPDIISMDDTWFPSMKGFLEELRYSQSYYDELSLRCSAPSNGRPGRAAGNTAFRSEWVAR
jgi:ABC-type glycerol-3-phosphate transport system substrate-binding protein